MKIKYLNTTPDLVKKLLFEGKKPSQIPLLSKSDAACSPLIIIMIHSISSMKTPLG